MEKDVVQNGIESPNEPGAEMAARLGQHYSELCRWAVSNGMEFPLEVSYHILGLDESEVAVGNLVHEFLHLESREITSEWSDHPIVLEFKTFAKALEEEDPRFNLAPRKPHRGGASKIKRDITEFRDRRFLLALTTNPLADNTDQARLKDRRRLRIWLIVQAAIRLINVQSSADRFISVAARFLVVDATSSQWALIDGLLERANKELGNTPCSFENFTTALERAAFYLKETRSEVGRGSKASRQFLSAIGAIAAGSSDAIQSRRTHAPIPDYLRSVPSPVDDLPFETDDQRFNVLIGDSSGDEDELAYVTEIDPTDSSAQQELRSGSVFMQTAELSHYLPWSWDRLLPPEVDQVESWIKYQLASQDVNERLGGALVWLAIRLSRSLAMIERVTVEPGGTAEWSLSTDFSRVKRKAPRRHSAWSPDASNIDQVAPFGEELKVQLPDDVRDSFAQMGVPGTDTKLALGDLWRNHSRSSLESWFNERARRYFPRVTSAKLGQCFGQKLFEQSGDFSFARLLTSHPQSALPGACSYATWDVKAIEKGLGLPVLKTDKESDDLHLMGSLLAPLDSVLSDEIRRANDKLEKAAGEGLIYYHNTLAQYVVMALYAATGGRFLKDPFELARHFSSSFDCVFINDKSDEGLHNGRIVPLPSTAGKLVEHYLQHMKALADLLREHREDLSRQLCLLVERKPANLPFFFLLDDHLQWHSLADAGMLQCETFNWALPGNLFRHRYSQRLMQESVDPEVIDGWMGHAERGVASYSDYSVRCWADDAAYYRNTLEKVFNVLPFVMPRTLQSLPPLQYTVPKGGKFVEPDLFGEKARAHQRKVKRQEAIKAAHDDIQFFLNRRQFNDLSNKELMDLSRHMLLRENCLPHPQAALRYRVFTKCLEKTMVQSHSAIEESSEKGTEDSEAGEAKRNILKRRMVSVRDERSLVEPDVMAKLDIFARLSNWASKQAKSTHKADFSKSRALCFGSVLLAIEKRLGYSRLLLDVAQGQHFRLLQDDRRYFLEYSEALEPDDFSAAVQRHEVSYKVASLLAHGASKNRETDEVVPGELAEFGPLLEIYQQEPQNTSQPSMNTLIEWLSAAINQANLVQLPGVVAAALSDRAPPTSPSLRDYVRIHHGRSIDLGDDEDISEDLPTVFLTKPRVQESDKLRLQANAKAFKTEVQGLLNQYERQRAREFARDLEGLCRKFTGDLSSSMLLAGYWITNHCRQGKGKKGKKLDPFAQNSLTTYWSYLASAFCGFLYDVDLVSLDQEDVTARCGDMLDHKVEMGRRPDYFAKRLQDFFQWASQYGVASPEWTELNLASNYRSVNPGLITEREYQDCQRVIQADQSVSPEERHWLGFVLLLCYRFGLRAQEAIGLLRRDWCNVDELRWVVIQKNPYRDLKSVASRRVIPLLFDLSPLEQDLVERVLGHHQALVSQETNLPILCELSPHSRPVLIHQASRIPAALIRVLRNVTGNPELVLHHCRHSFYNRLAPALLGIQTPLSQRLSDDNRAEGVRRTVLGATHHVSRRSTMAMARLMGHRFPSTGLGSYFHGMTDWCDALTPVTTPRARRIQGVLQVSELPQRPEATLPAMAESLDYTQPSVGSLLKLLRLVATGIPYDRAGELLLLHPNLVARLEFAVTETTSRMRFSSPHDKNVKLRGADYPNALLEPISDAAWQRLIYHAQKSGDLSVEGLPPENASHLHDIPYLVGPNRHILMDRPGHYWLVKQVLNLFEVSDTDYRVVSQRNSEKGLKKMQRAGFDVRRAEEISSNLDRFPVYIPDRDSRSAILDYGGLIMSRARDGVVRNSFELSVALLVVGALVQEKVDIR